MARNNLTWIKGDITGDIYYDNFHLDSKDVQYSPVPGESVPDDRRRCSRIDASHGHLNLGKQGPVLMDSGSTYE